MRPPRYIKSWRLVSAPERNAYVQSDNWTRMLRSWLWKYRFDHGSSNAMNVTTQSGLVLAGRQAELYTGECPQERPCSEMVVNLYRKRYDSVPAETKPMPALPPGTTKSKLWKFAGQLYSYLEAKARWAAAGFPVPSPEELRKRELTCFTCIWHDHKRDGCRICGCGDTGGSLSEKRGMATEQCSDDQNPRWLPCVPPTNK